MKKYYPKALPQQEHDEIDMSSEKLLSEMRGLLAREEELDDDKALTIIENHIFSLKQIESKTVSEITDIIEKLYYKTRKIVGILEPLINDDMVSEIMVNGPKKIFYEKEGQVYEYKYSFDSVEELEEVMRNIVGEVNREINEMNPIVDARLANGSRVNGVYKNVAINGPVLTIRKFLDKYITMEDLISNGTISKEGGRVLQTLVRCGYNIFVSGGTSSGKTTLLNALASAIPKEERVIVVEDSMELKMNDIDNIVHMECRNSNYSGRGRVSMTELIRSSLRMRPNRIIVGEVRGGEVVDMLQAMNTGHSGSMSTGHGNSVEGMLRRLESMFLMAAPLHIDAIRSQISEGIDIMVHLEKMDDGQRKVTEVVELCGYDDGKFILNPLLELDSDCKFRRTGNVMKRDRKAKLRGGENADFLRQHKFIN